MFSLFFHTTIYNPLYNGIVFLMSLIPFADLGIIVILFTLFIRLILFPISRKAVQTQLALKALDPEIKKIRQEYNNKEEQARRLMLLYKTNNINPFSSVFLVLIQLPIIFALYFIFLRSGFPLIHTEILYSFVHVPQTVNPVFLGLVDMTKKSIVLSVCAGLTQFLQAWIVAPTIETKKNVSPSIADDIARGMQLQMRYVLPIVIAFIAYSLSSLVALYWATSNLFTIGQELFMRRAAKKLEG